MFPPPLLPGSAREISGRVEPLATTTTTTTTIGSCNQVSCDYSGGGRIQEEIRLQGYSVGTSETTTSHVDGQWRSGDENNAGRGNSDEHDRVSLRRDRFEMLQCLPLMRRFKVKSRWRARARPSLCTRDARPSPLLLPLIPSFD